MGQLVYPTWAALSPSGEGSRHGRAGLGEGPRQAGQDFRCGVVNVRHVGIRAPVPHELNEERGGDAHAVGEGCNTTSEGVSRELRRIHAADLANAVSQGDDKHPGRGGVILETKMYAICYLHEGLGFA